MGRVVQAALTALAFGFLAGAAKINTPRVLLPWLGADTRVNFTFEISDGGCYSWSLSRDDLISLEAMYEDSWGHCSRAARVAPLAACSPPGSVIILAEDVNTGEIIRGDVDVDRISSLRLVSTTWKLYLEEAPEAFELEAFDDQGNKFSSLEGLEFKWTVENTEDEKQEEPVVKLVWWSDTDYEAPRGISELESQGRRSHSALLYGQTMGEARVVACLNATCADVALRVVASVVLTPAVAVVSPGDSIRYKVVRARAGRLTIEDIGDTVYRLRVPDDGIAYLEDSVSLVEGRTLGTTSLSLVSGLTEVASSTLTVSTPHSIRVVLRPSDLLVRGEPFVVHTIVMDKQGRALTAGEKMLVRLSVEGEADVNLVRSTENGTLTDAVPYATGLATITAQLHSVGGKTYSKKVEGSAEATVVEPLEVIPPELFIAWTDIPIEVQLRHRGGGERRVVWSAEETSGEVGVGVAGVVRAASVGRVTVRAQLAEHPHVRAHAQVWALEAQYLQVASSGHARVGRPHLLHVALTGAHPTTGGLFTFHKCDCNSFAVTLLEGPEPQNITAADWIEPLEGACCVLAGVWRERGACSLRVARGNVGDTARVLVRAAPRLVWPPAAAMLLAATLPVLAAGEALAARTADPGVSDVRLRAPPAPRAHPDLQLFTLTCLRSGETTLELESRSAEEERWEVGGSAVVACAAGAARVRLDAPGGNCSGGARLWLRAGGRAALSVALLDAAGRELLDERGHRMSWETSPSHSALEYASPDRLFVETDPEYDPVPVPLRYYQIIRAGEAAAGWTGTIRASAGDASATIHAHVVAPLVATPQQASVAWEGATASNVAMVTGGSGRYAVEVQKGASASLDATAGQLSATWPAPGRYQLHVTDTCLADERVTLDVRVEKVVSVEVAGPRVVCVDTCVSLAATARGASGRALVAASPPEWSVAGGAEFREGRLCGVKEGVARVKASLAGVWSSELEVVVFPVLRVRPARVRVPPGARLQLAHAGGPPAHLATFLYVAAQPDDTLLVSQSGLLSGQRVGSGRVRLTARDRAGVEIAHAEAEVEVVGVTGVRGLAATHTLLVGAETPLWLEAAPALGPEALAALHPAPRVTWSLRDPAAAVLTVPLHAIQSMDKSTAEGLSVRLTPLRDGLITVDVRVRNFVQSGETRSWDTTVEILAVQELAASIEGLDRDIDSGSVAVAVGATIQLRSSLRASWRAVPSDAPVFEVTPAGELRALRNGFGVAIGRYRDERNNYERETVVSVEVATPHYLTTQTAAPGGEEEPTLLVEARSALGRRLLAHNLTLHHHARLRYHPHSHSRLTGTEVAVSGVDAGGAFALIEASWGATVLRDYVWLEGPDRSAERVVAGAGHALCLPGGGWRAPEGAGVWLGERGGVTLAVTLAVLLAPGAARLQLKAERPTRTLAIIQSPLTKMEFIAGEWPAALVPLSLEAGGRAASGSGGGGGGVHCTEEQRSAVAELQPPLPYHCHAPEPYTAKPLLDTFIGEMGCSVRSDAPVTDATEVEVCAEWGSLHACTLVLLLPPVRLTTDKLTLTESKESFVATGHPTALSSITVSASPGLKTSSESAAEGLRVWVWSEERECGAGWVWVRARRTAQEWRVLVERECQATCGSLLGIVFALLSPHLFTIGTAVLAAAGAIYFYTNIVLNWTVWRNKAVPAVTTVPRASASPPRTWHRSPYASPKPSPPRSPPAPIYGDTSVLPDSSFSPNTPRTHSRFL